MNCSKSLSFFGALTVGSIVASSVAPTAVGSLVAQDLFQTGGAQYIVSPTSIAGQAPVETGFSSANAWTANNSLGTATVQSSSLAYSDLNYTIPTVGGSLLVTPGSGERVGRTFDGSLLASGQSSTVYMSFLMQLSSGGGYSAFELDNGAGFDDNANRVLNLGVGVNGGIGVGVNGGPSANLSAFNANVVLYILKFTINPTPGSDALTVWEDPTITGPGDPTGGSSVSFTGLTLLPTITTVTGASFGGGNVAIDNFTVGTTLADVVAVPEPSTWAAFVTGGFSLFCLVRRKAA